jgi:heat-inducible transcriptional repressor
LSGLSACAGVVVAPKIERRLRQLAFVPLGQGQALAMLVGDDGSVENRMVSLPPGSHRGGAERDCRVCHRAACRAYLVEAEARLRQEIRERREALDAAAAELVATGPGRMAGGWAGAADPDRARQANLLDEAAALDLERVRRLLDELEDRQEIVRLLESAREGRDAASSSARRTGCSRFRAQA